jgi:hypothetical protein
MGISHQRTSVVGGGFFIFSCACIVMYLFATCIRSLTLAVLMGRGMGLFFVVLGWGEWV